MMDMQLKLGVVVLAMAGLAIAPAFGGVEEEADVDVMVLIGPTGELVTGTVNFDEQLFLGFSRAFEGEFARFDVGGGVQIATTDEPGFNAVANGNASLPAGYTSLTAGTALTFDANAIEIGGGIANLWHWDGVGDVDFSPASIALDVSKAPSAAFNATLDGSASGVAGFEISTAEANGTIHQHLDLGIDNAQLAPDGFYLWSFTLSTDTGLQADPIFFVHGLGDGLLGEQHEAAVDWVNLNLVPAPGAALLCVAGLGGLVRRRR